MNQTCGIIGQIGESKCSIDACSRTCAVHCSENAVKVGLWRGCWMKIFMASMFIRHKVEI